MSEKRPSAATDKSLIERAQQGDRQAFGELYERYAAVIYRYLRSRVATEQEAEDLTEAAFLKAFEAIGRYKDQGHPYSAYLYRIAKNLLADHYRAAREVIALEELKDEDPTGELDEALIGQERERQVRAAMERLAGDYQEVIRLRILLEMSTAEVADWMGRSEGAVRVLLHRALRALSEQLVEREE